MQFPPLLEGRLIRRYKRFFADVELVDGGQVTAHCPNTGSMKNCCDPGSRVWLSDSNNPKRKLPLTWELVEVEERYLACVNTNRANRVVREALEAGVVPELTGYDEVLPEQRYGQENSRIDFLLRGEGLVDCYVEVKNVTLLEPAGLESKESDSLGRGLFPDAVTTRGTKHLRELQQMVEAGNRAVLLFHVPHTGIWQVSPAQAIDPLYAQTLAQVMTSGVEVLAYAATLTPDEIALGGRLEFQL